MIIFAYKVLAAREFSPDSLLIFYSVYEREILSVNSTPMVLFCRFHSVSVCSHIYSGIRFVSFFGNVFTRNPEPVREADRIYNFFLEENCYYLLTFTRIKR